MQLLFAILISVSAMSQPIYKADLPDRIAGPSDPTPGATANTGYDLMVGLGESVNGLAVGCNLTAAVWDGSTSSLGGIHVNKGKTSVTKTWEALLKYNLTDPDVVVGYYNSKLYITVVGVGSTDHRIHVISITTFCNDSEKKLDLYVENDCAIGTYQDPNPEHHAISNGYFTSSGRIVSYPNIDANSAGQIAVVWQESVSYSFFFHLDAPAPPFQSPSPGFNFTYTSGESNIYAIHGFIDGTNTNYTGLFCASTGLSDCAVHVNIGNGESVGGSPASNYYSITSQGGEFPSTVGTNNDYNPDVAIGQGDHPFVSYSYMNNGLLNVYQHHWGVCPDNSVDNILTHYTNFYGQKPRIAAKPSSSDQMDFVVVGGLQYTEPCPSFAPKGYISAIWREFGMDQLTAVFLNDNLDLRNVYNTDPVVSYFLDHDGDKYNTLKHGSTAEQKLADTWIVAWTVTDAQISGYSTSGLDDDVIARQYNPDGSPFFSPNYYSFVNEYNTSIGKTMAGNQRIPSIASRYGEGSIGYAFNDEHLDGAATYAITKLSVYDFPGNSPIHHDGRGNCTDCDGSEGDYEKRLKPNPINIYPNPGEGSFGIKLAETDYSTEAIISVTDAKGNVLLKQDWNKSQGEPKIVLKDLPAGLYNVQFTTPDGVSRRSLYNNQK